MAKKSLTLTVRAKNMLAKGMTSAKATLKKFGSAVAGAGRMIAKGFLVAGAAVVTLGTKAVQAYAIQEGAEKSLTAAMNAHGEAANKLLPSLKKVASAIQDETGVADESTLAGMAKMRMLGVQTSKLEEAAKGVIALKSLGLEEAAAQKAVAMAMQGNFEMLNRYVPALRSATSEEEKALIVKSLLEKGYKQQAALLGTVGGQWVAFKGRIGDFLEVIGKAISENAQITNGLKRAGDAVKSFGERVAEWAGSGGIAYLQFTAKVFFLNVKHGFKNAAGNAAVFFATIRDASAFKYITSVTKAYVNVFIQQFLLLRETAKATWDFIKHVGTKAFEPPSMKPYLDSYKNLFKAVKGEQIKATNHRKKALEAQEKLQQEYNKKIVDLEKDLNKKVAKQKEKTKAEPKADDSAMKAQSDSDKKAKTDKKAADKKKKLVKEVAELEKKYAAQRLIELNKRIAATEKAAKRSVKDILNANKNRNKKSPEDAQWEEDKKRANKIALKFRRFGRGGLGGTQAEKDKKFLDAAREKQGDINKLAELKGEKAGMSPLLKSSEDIKAELVKLRADITEIMKGG